MPTLSKICYECGADMQLRTIQKGDMRHPSIKRWECKCGHSETHERTMEREANDQLDRKALSGLKKKKIDY